MKLHTEGSAAFRVHLKSALEAFTEVCVTSDGINQLPRLCAATFTEADMVKTLLQYIVMGPMTYHFLFFSC